jgi:hypothetical protein
LSTARVLKAKAWKTGMPTGNTGSAACTMKVALPGVSPAAGTYTRARTVTLSTATPGATLRDALDGTNPTPASPEYTSALTIGTTTTLKAVGVKADWSDSDLRTATYTMNFGTLTLRRAHDLGCHPTRRPSRPRWAPRRSACRGWWRPR